MSYDIETYSKMFPNIDKEVIEIVCEQNVDLQLTLEALLEMSGNKKNDPNHNSTDNSNTSEVTSHNDEENDSNSESIIQPFWLSEIFSGNNGYKKIDSE